MKRLLLGLLLLLVACSRSVETEPVGEIEVVARNGGWYSIHRLVDKDAGVVCYVGDSGTGLFCLPINETRLGQ